MLAQLGDRSHPEELHRGLELPGEQVERAVHAGLAANHQPVHVGPPERRRVGAQGKRDRHVRPVAHTGIDQYRERRPHGLPHRRDQVNGRHGTVQLPSPVVGQLHTVHAKLKSPPGVRGSNRSLEQQLPRPPGPQVRNIGPVQVGLEEVRRLHHRCRRPPGEVGVVERRPGEQVVPVGRLQRHRRDGGQGQRGRNGQPVAQVPYPIARHDRVHRHHERRELIVRGPRDQVDGLGPVPGQVELKPQVAAGSHPRPQLLDPGGRHRGERVRQPVPQRRAGRADLTVRVQHPRVPDGPEQQRHRQ